MTESETTCHARVEVTDDFIDHRTIWVDGRSIAVIGRDVSSEIWTAHRSVSRRHASVTRHEERWVLEDLDSSNGTFVNDSRVSRALLSNGDRIRCGKLTIEWRDGAVETAMESHGARAAADLRHARRSAVRAAAALHDAVHRPSKPRPAARTGRAESRALRQDNAALQARVLRHGEELRQAREDVASLAILQAKQLEEAAAKDRTIAALRGVIASAQEQRPTSAQSDTQSDSAMVRLPSRERL